MSNLDVSIAIVMYFYAKRQVFFLKIVGMIWFAIFFRIFGKNYVRLVNIFNQATEESEEIGFWFRNSLF